MSGPCLSSSVAGRPLRPATRHSLGEPLPHQLADRPRGHQEAPGCPGFGIVKMSPLATCGINSPFGELSPTFGQVAHVLRTLAPLNLPRIATRQVPFDLHVLSTPPAFVLSQNQTLRKKRMRPDLHRSPKFAQATAKVAAKSDRSIPTEASTEVVSSHGVCPIYNI